MATNTSASIIYSNTPVTAGPIGNVSGHGHLVSTNNVVLGNGDAIGMWVNQSSGGSARLGEAFLEPGSPTLDFIRATGSAVLRKLSSGAEISAGGNFVHGGGSVDFHGLRTNIPGYRNMFGQWATGSAGFAGFDFSNTDTHTVNYGWVKLVYTVGSNGLANSITAIDWAYDNTGNPIKAGQETGSTPEPSTFAMGLLAAGAVGVIALRQPRKCSNSGKTVGL
jgi:hypothetical protein